MGSDTCNFTLKFFSVFLFHVGVSHILKNNLKHYTDLKFIAGHSTVWYHEIENCCPVPFLPFKVNLTLTQQCSLNMLCKEDYMHLNMRIKFNFPKYLTRIKTCYLPNGLSKM